VTKKLKNKPATNTKFTVQPLTMHGNSKIKPSENYLKLNASAMKRINSVSVYTKTVESEIESARKYLRGEP